MSESKTSGTKMAERTRLRLPEGPGRIKPAAAHMKLGLEALRSANDAELNRDAVEVTVVDSNGYRVLDRGEVNKQIDRLKPLED